MKAPAFWWQPRPTLAARLLAPAGALYGAVTARRMAGAGLDPGVPVLCVGNLVAGGAGKTPTAMALAAMLLADGRRPAFVSRGYGRASDGPSCLQVDLARHSAAETGDEPMLLATAAPTFVSADRVLAARAAVANGADCMILDDGLQNPALHKHWSVAVVDGGSGIGNGLCIPAGPLRSPVARQWPAVSLVCIIGEGAPGDRLAAHAQRAGVPVTRARLVPDSKVVESWRGQRLIAVAGIGRPEKFFATLRNAGLPLSATFAFPDHHRFTSADLGRLARAAENGLLVTTTKDRVRLPRDFAAAVLPVELAFEQPARVRASLPFSA